MVRQMPFLVIFVIVPLLEVYAFISVGDEIGVLRTLLLCVLTAMIGGFLVRQQGLDTLFKAQAGLSQGQLPVRELFDGFCLVIAGALLLTPGFVTDTIGFSLLVPPFRTFLRSALSKHGKFNVHSKSTHTATEEGVIEGDYETVIKEHEKLDKSE